MKKLLLFTCLGFLLQLKAQETELWGVAPLGGANGGGSIIKTEGDGSNISVVHNFETTPGQRPTGGLVLANNGKLYGGTNFGGLYGSGVIFAYNPSDGSYEVIKNLESTIGTNFGGTFTLCSNGKLYGRTSLTGSNYQGTLIEVDPATNAFTVVYHFGNADGSGAKGNLVELESGVLYGIQPNGGVNSQGTFFKYDVNTGILTKLTDFTSYMAINKLIKGIDNNLYGISNTNKLYEFNPNNGAIVEHNIGTNITIVGDLINGANGEIYGVTNTGGNFGYGTLYEYNPNTGAINHLVHFDAVTGSPKFTPLQFSNSEVLVLTEITNSDAATILSKVNITLGQVSTLSSFDFPIKQPNSINNFNEMVVDDSGNLFGTIVRGGINDTGILYKYKLDTDELSVEINFSGSEEGNHPTTGLVNADNDKLYGVTSLNGVYGSGVIYEIDPANNIYTKKFDFERGATGYYPIGLINGGNGKLYGVTRGDGELSEGKLFSYDINTEVYTILHNFTEATGTLPNSNIFMATNGKLYGIANFGGQYDNGAFFEFDPVTNTYSKKYDFNYDITGIQTWGSPFQASNGKLYLTTLLGGPYQYGTLLEFDITTNAMTIKYNFNYLNAGYSVGALVEKEEGHLYGLSHVGGGLGEGSLFEYNFLTDSFTVKAEFGINSEFFAPSEGFYLASNGLLYGVAHYGGANGGGAIYEYNPTTNTVTSKSDFDFTIGYHSACQLIEIPASPLGIDDISNQDSFVLYPNPVKDKLYVKGNEPITSIAIYDMSGKLVISENKVTDAIDISGLTPGLYMVQGYADDNTFYKKLIVE